MTKFYKIVLPNKKSYVVVSKNGYAGLLDMVEYVYDKDNTYIIPLTLFKFIKYVMGWQYDKN